MRQMHLEGEGGGYRDRSLGSGCAGRGIQGQTNRQWDEGWAVGYADGSGGGIPSIRDSAWGATSLHSELDMWLVQGRSQELHASRFQGVWYLLLGGPVVICTLCKHLLRSSFRTPTFHRLCMAPVRVPCDTPGRQGIRHRPGRDLLTSQESLIDTSHTYPATDLASNAGESYSAEVTDLLFPDQPTSHHGLEVGIGPSSCLRVDSPCICQTDANDRSYQSSEARMSRSVGSETTFPEALEAFRGDRAVLLPPLRTPSLGLIFDVEACYYKAAHLLALCGW